MSRSVHLLATLNSYSASIQTQKENTAYYYLHLIYFIGLIDLCFIRTQRKLTSEMAEPLPKYLYCIPFFLAATAFVLAFVGTSCHYINFTDAGTGTDLHFGYWYYQSWSVSNSTTSNSTNTDSVEEIQGESCKLYPSNVNVDSSWQAARVFNLIVIILGGSVLLLDMFQGCMSTKRNVSFRLGSIGYFICSICAAFSLLLLDSNVCKNNTLIEELNGSAQVSFQETVFHFHQ